MFEAGRGGLELGSARSLFGGSALLELEEGGAEGDEVLGETTEKEGHEGLLEGRQVN